jgi:hypothetical protein
MVVLYPCLETAYLGKCVLVFRGDDNVAEEKSVILQKRWATRSGR